MIRLITDWETSHISSLIFTGGGGKISEKFGLQWAYFRKEATYLKFKTNLLRDYDGTMSPPNLVQYGHLPLRTSPDKIAPGKMGRKNVSSHQ